MEQFGHWPNEQELASLSAPIQTEFTAEPNKDECETFSFFSYGAVFVEVHVDLFGQVRLKRATGVYDAGRMINPKLARSQIMGGLIFAISSVLFEVFRPNGQPADPHTGCRKHCIRNRRNNWWNRRLTHAKRQRRVRTDDVDFNRRGVLHSSHCKICKCALLRRASAKSDFAF